MDDAKRAQGSARVETDRAWDEACGCVEEVETTSSMLHKAQDAYSNAKRASIVQTDEHALGVVASVMRLSAA